MQQCEHNQNIEIGKRWNRFKREIHKFEMQRGLKITLSKTKDPKA